MRGRTWTEADIDTLLDEYGRVPADVLARRLGRTREALKVKAVRLGVNQRETWLTSRDVARLLGVDAKRVVYLHELGLLPGRRSSVGVGLNWMWRFEVAALERFLAQHHAWYDPRRISEEPWRSLARAAHARDPLLSTTEAARLLGVATGTVQKHLRNGWLLGERVRSCGGPGAWRIRRADVAAFQPRNPATAHVVVLRSVAGVNARKRVRAKPPGRVRGPVRQYEPRGRRVRLQATVWRAS